MMKTDDIKDILERYYDGDASPVEIESLKRYFAGTKDIPAYLRADAAMFRAMNSDMSRQLNTMPPAGLGKRILDATVNASEASSANEPLRKRRFSWKLVISSAAAVAAIITVATLIFNYGQDNGTKGSEYIAQSDQPAVPLSGTTESAAVIAATPGENGHQIAMKETAPLPEASVKADKPRRAVAARKITDDEMLAGNYREVTDSAKAVAIANAAFACLSENLSKAGNTVRESEATLRSLRNPISFISDEL